MSPARPSSSLLNTVIRVGGSVLLAFGCSEDTGFIEPGPATGGGAGMAGASGTAAGMMGAGTGAAGAGAGAVGAAGVGGTSGAAGVGSGGGGAGGRGGSSGAAAAGRGGGTAGDGAEGGEQGDAGKGGGGGNGGGAGASGSSGTAGAATTSCAELPLCDEFETYAEGATPNGIWSKQGGGSATVDTSRPHRGAQSVHIVTGESEQGRVWLHTTSDRVFPTRHMFGRLWMYLDALPTTEVHWDMIEGQGIADEPEAWDDPFEIALRYGGQLDENLLANFETPGSYGGDGPRTDCAKFSDTRMPFGRWACMEWEFDSDAEVMRFWLDGEIVDDLEVEKQGTQCISDETNGVWYYPTFESLNIGWREWWEAGTRELWIDDVAVAGERIGCE